MDLIFGWFKELFMIAPFPAAAIIVGWFWFKSRKDAPKQKAENKTEVEKFVLRDEYHTHIDGLKNDMNTRFVEIKADIRELRDFLFDMVKK